MKRTFKKILDFLENFISKSIHFIIHYPLIVLSFIIAAVVVVVYKMLGKDHHTLDGVHDETDGFDEVDRIIINDSVYNEVFSEREKPTVKEIKNIAHEDDIKEVDKISLESDEVKNNDKSEVDPDKILKDIEKHE